MKKVLAFILISVMLLGLLTSCNEYEQPENAETSKDTVDENLCNHQGGFATCKTPAICSTCKNPYGSIDPNKHIVDKTWQKSETAHRQLYTCCGLTVVEKEIHEWNEGKCSECDYICLHNDSNGDTDHKCDYCTTITSSCVDFDKNHMCDECGTNIGTHSDSNNDADHNCDYCNAVLSLCVDLTKNHTCDECGIFMGIHGDTLDDIDHACDYCGIIITNCTDLDRNHICDECGALVGQHVDKLGNGKHQCEYCNEYAGECFDENKDHLCDECNDNIGIHADDINDGNHECDYCKETITQCIDVDNNRICDECHAHYYSSGFVYAKNADGASYTIINIGSCTDVNLTVPKTYNDLPITAIGESAFANCSFITSVTIHNNIKRIEKDAFYGCLGILEVYVDDLLSWSKMELVNNYSTPVFFSESINFKNTSGQYEKLTELLIDNSFNEIKPYTFGYLISLNKVIFTSQNLSIQNFAFDDSYNIKTVCVESLEDWCNITFENAQSNPVLYSKKLYVKNSNGEYDELINITIPDTINQLSAFAFAYLEGVENIELNNVTTIGDYAFSECFNLTNVVIPDTVTKIGKGIFCEANINSLTFVNENDIYIDNSAFTMIYGLKSITISGKTLSYIQPSSSIKNIKVICGALGRDALYGFNELEYLEIGKDVTDVKYYAFINDISNTSYCPKIKSIIVDINNSECKSIDGNLYNKDGTSLIQYALGKEDTTYIIPDGVKYVGSFALSGARNLTHIVIPESVTNFGYCSFSGCSNLISVEFKKPNGWTYCSNPVENLSNTSTAAKLVRQYYEGWIRVD